VLEGRRTFEIVERFENDCYDAERSELARLEERLVAVRRHTHEEALRIRRRADRPAFLGAKAGEQNAGSAGSAPGPG
jgi:hypothetical protein